MESSDPTTLVVESSLVRERHWPPNKEVQKAVTSVQLGNIVGHVQKLQGSLRTISFLLSFSVNLEHNNSVRIVNILWVVQVNGCPEKLTSMISITNNINK